MPPEYVATLRSAASVSEKRSSRSSAIAPGSVEVPQPGDQHEVLPPAEDLVHGGELPGQADGRRAPAPAALATSKPSTVAVPRVGPEQRGQDPHQRGLAGAVGAEQGEDAARGRRSRSTPRSTSRSPYDFSRP